MGSGASQADGRGAGARRGWREWWSDESAEGAAFSCPFVFFVGNPPTSLSPRRTRSATEGMEVAGSPPGSRVAGPMSKVQSRQRLRGAEPNTHRLARPGGRVTTFRPSTFRPETIPPSFRARSCVSWATLRPVFSPRRTRSATEGTEVAGSSPGARVAGPMSKVPKSPAAPRRGAKPTPAGPPRRAGDDLRSLDLQTCDASRARYAPTIRSAPHTPAARVGGAAPERIARVGPALGHPPNHGRATARAHHTVGRFQP